MYSLVRWTSFSMCSSSKFGTCHSSLCYSNSAGKTSRISWDSSSNFIMPPSKVSDDLFPFFKYPIFIFSSLLSSQPKIFFFLKGMETYRVSKRLRRHRRGKVKMTVALVINEATRKPASKMRNRPRPLPQVQHQQM